jgi:hypothetical protein
MQKKKAPPCQNGQKSSLSRLVDGMFPASYRQEEQKSRTNPEANQKQNKAN